MTGNYLSYPNVEFFSYHVLFFAFRSNRFYESSITTGNLYCILGISTKLLWSKTISSQGTWYNLVSFVRDAMGFFLSRTIAGVVWCRSRRVVDGLHLSTAANLPGSANLISKNWFMMVHLLRFTHGRRLPIFGACMVLLTYFTLHPSMI